MGVFDTIANAMEGKSSSTSGGKTDETPGGTPLNQKGDTAEMTKLHAAKERMMADKGLDFEGNPLPKQNKKQSDNKTDKKKKPTYQRLYKDTK